MDNEPKRVVVGVTGATGAALAKRCLELLGTVGVERELVISPDGRRNVALELPGQRLEDHAEVVHPWKNMGASIASGSYPFDAVLVVPCSIRTMSSVAYGLTDNLIARVADVGLKERRRVVLCVRETPLHTGHLRAMLAASEAGAIIFPPVPAFYHLPRTVDELVDHLAHRLVDVCGIRVPGGPVWNGDGGGTGVGGSNS